MNREDCYFSWLCLTAWTIAQGQEPPRLQATLNTEKTLIRLELQGRTAANYEIEASSDLKVWTPVANGHAGNGIFLNDQPLSGHHRFFRGRESAGSTNGGTPPISITPQVDTNVSVTFLVSTNGGSTILYAPDGTEIRFTVPPLTLPEAEIITMTLVTNAGGFPFSQGILGAVRLEPDRLALWGAGTLEISLPAELDARRIVSFTARGNGSSFQLTPDRVGTNTVLIPVTQLGLVGSALALDTELPSTANSASFIRQNALRAQSAGAPECFPDREAEAQFFDGHFTQIAERFSQRLASALVRARRAQSAGSRGDTFNFSAAERAELDVCSLIDELTGPIATQAAGNCALGTMIVRHLRRIERQRQLLNLPTDDPRCPVGFDEQRGCAILKNCIQEIKQCCESGIRGPQQIAAIYRNVRYDQARGNPCLSAAEVDEAVASCTPGRWTGNLTLKVTGRDSESNPLSGTSVLRNLTEEFHGQVIDSQEILFGDTISISLRVEGVLAFHYDDTLIIANPGDCGGFFQYNYKDESAKGAVIFNVNFSITSGQAPSVTIVPDAEKLATGIRSGHGFERTGKYIFTERGRECEIKTLPRPVPTEKLTLNSSGSLFGAPATFQGDTLSGAGQVLPHQLRVPGAGTFDWVFHRHPERQ